MSDDADRDAQLVGRIARGDSAAFGAVYDRYLPLVLRWSLRETGNRELAADLAAETFAAALIASPRYRRSQGAVPDAPPGAARAGGGAAFLTGHDGSLIVGRASFTIR